MKKKTWVTPELIVLVRRKPEEGILVNCQDSGSGSNQTGDDVACWVDVGGLCLSCDL